MSSYDDEDLAFPTLPAAPPSKHIGQGYSTSNPVPTVQQYRETQQKHEQQAKEYSDLMDRREAAARRRAQEQEERERQAAMQDADGEEDGDADGDDTRTLDDGTVVQKGTQKDTGKNAVKNTKHKKNKVDPNRPPTEKEKLMDQMNSNKG